MQGIRVQYFLMFPCYGDGVALSGIEGHTPFVLPVLKAVYVVLQDGTVRVRLNLPIDHAVISEEAHI